jgi:hypothetical protein
MFTILRVLWRFSKRRYKSINFKNIPKFSDASKSYQKFRDKVTDSTSLINRVKNSPKELKKRTIARVQVAKLGVDVAKEIAIIWAITETLEEAGVLLDIPDTFIDSEGNPTEEGLSFFQHFALHWNSIPMEERGEFLAGLIGLAITGKGIAKYATLKLKNSGHKFRNLDFVVNGKTKVRTSVSTSMSKVKDLTVDAKAVSINVWNGIRNVKMKELAVNKKFQVGAASAVGLASISAWYLSEGSDDHCLNEESDILAKPVSPRRSTSRLNKWLDLSDPNSDPIHFEYDRVLYHPADLYETLCDELFLAETDDNYSSMIFSNFQGASKMSYLFYINTLRNLVFNYHEPIKGIHKLQTEELRTAERLRIAYLVRDEVRMLSQLKLDSDNHFSTVDLESQLVAVSAKSTGTNDDNGQNGLTLGLR